MKKFHLSFLLALISLTSFAQKFDREYFNLQHMHVPSRLVYDQIKNYGYKISTRGEYLPIDLINRSLPGLNSFANVPYEDADMKLDIIYGPYQLIEEKTVSSTRTEEVNKVKVTNTYYTRTLSFRFPITYRVVNAKNNTLLYGGDYANSNVNTISSGESRSEADVYNAINNNRPTLVGNKLTEIISSFVGSYNATYKNSFDFYNVNTSMDIYQFKKWKQDDEYNVHVKNVKKVFGASTFDESPANNLKLIQADIDYFKSFDGVFNPTDKNEDILYWGNYYNLATIFYCLDDFDQADIYIAKLDSSKKQTNNTKGLKGMINNDRNKLKRHFLTNRHFIYNPVTDYKLTGLAFTSDAASASENMASSLTAGKVEANDVVTFIDNTEKKGKIIYDAPKNQLSFIPIDDVSKITILSPLSVLKFTKDSADFVVIKNTSASNNPVKQFFKILYSSEKIKLYGYCDNNLVPNLTYSAIMKKTDTELFFLQSLSMKKKIAAHFEECETVSKNAKSGDYGKGLNYKIEQFLQLCKDYDACN